MGASSTRRLARSTSSERSRRRPLLAGCQREGDVAARQLDGGGVEFTKHLLHTATGDRCVLVERLRPTGNSIRWEIEIRGQGKPWSTADRDLRCNIPPRRTTRFWTTWSDSQAGRCRAGPFWATARRADGRLRSNDSPIQYPGWTDPLVVDAAAQYNTITARPITARPIGRCAYLPVCGWTCSASRWPRSSSRRMMLV